MKIESLWVEGSGLTTNEALADARSRAISATQGHTGWRETFYGFSAPMDDAKHPVCCALRMERDLEDTKPRRWRWLS